MIGSGRARHSLLSLLLVALLAGGVVAVAATNAPAEDEPFEFVKGVLAGAEADKVTTLAFGPDGRLYVGQQTGIIRVLTVERDGPGRYRVTGRETVGALVGLDNRDDHGAVDPELIGRLLTGLVVTGPADRPVIYAATSDPRFGGGFDEAEADSGLDTNSGVLSRLTPDPAGTGWRRHDLVRGLPRSQENHASNGLALDPTGTRLYLAQGGNTNNGAPAKPFVLTPEYALSGAILEIDLAAIGEATYDLPTLDDPSRPGDPDAGDPFGGNRGLNQARLVPGGPVRVHAPGFRNPYDVVMTEAGRLYSVDNGSNPRWGSPPGEAGGRCTNRPREGGERLPDTLHLISGPGYYGGHPNPTRANPANRFAGQSPVSAANPVECRFRPGGRSGALTTFDFSTNGLAEYRATGPFDGRLAGDLLAAGFDNAIYRLDLDATGRLAAKSVLLGQVGVVPLDVIAQGDEDVFPGTIWVGDIGAESITVYEPAGGRHRSVTHTSTSASSLRRSGSDRPTTLPWSPSMPSTKGAK